MITLFDDNTIVLFIFIGLLLIGFGFRGKRIDSFPYCRSCGYNLNGIDWHDGCVECGAELHSHKSIQMGAKKLRYKIMVLGILVSIILPLSKECFLRGFYWRNSLDRPLWVLIWELNQFTEKSVSQAQPNSKHQIIFNSKENLRVIEAILNQNFEKQNDKRIFVIENLINSLSGDSIKEINSMYDRHDIMQPRYYALDALIGEIKSKSMREKYLKRYMKESCTVLISKTRWDAETQSVWVKLAIRNPHKEIPSSMDAHDQLYFGGYISGKIESIESTLYDTNNSQKKVGTIVLEDDDNLSGEIVSDSVFPQSNSQNKSIGSIAIKQEKYWNLYGGTDHIVQGKDAINKIQIHCILTLQLKDPKSNKIIHAWQARAVRNGVVKKDDILK